MITRSAASLQNRSWQDELNSLITCPEHLLGLLHLPNHYLPAAKKAAALFPLRATASFVARIKPGDPHDPLLRQILPLQDELSTAAGFSRDPLGERAFNPVPGIVHKYANRVLFIAASQCAINCRYCFRRHFPYSDNQLNRNQWQSALQYVRDNPQLNEVILSGGDPLSLADRQLAWLIEEVAAIAHIKRLRIHSRYPVILPSRITPEFIRLLTSTRLQAVLVVHCNHPQEIDEAVGEAFDRLRRAQICLLNQTVLLKGINDDIAVLTELSEALFAAGALPYYLHLLDRVEGAAHFMLDDLSARQLYAELLTRLPGYLVPKLVREQANERSKTPVAPAGDEQQAILHSMIGK